jgi:hypothetical protein
VVGHDLDATVGKVDTVFSLKEYKRKRVEQLYFLQVSLFLRISNGFTGVLCSCQ